MFHWTNIRVAGDLRRHVAHVTLLWYNTPRKCCFIACMAGSRRVPSQWETSLQSNAVSHWLVANPESAGVYWLTWIVCFHVFIPCFFGVFINFLSEFLKRRQHRIWQVLKNKDIYICIWYCKIHNIPQLQTLCEILKSQNAQVAYIHILSKGLWRYVKPWKFASKSVHDDLIKWKHFPRYWPFVRGIHWPPVNSPYKGQWRGALMFSLICAWINGWVNNREAGDLRRYRAHYDVILMLPEALDINQPVTRSQVAHLSYPLPLWCTRKMDHLPQSCKYNDVNMKLYTYRTIVI